MENENNHNPDTRKKRRRPTLDGILSDLLIAAGATLLALGALMICVPAGCFVGGAELVAIGWLVGVGAKGGDAD